ncbi:MAG: transposase [Acidobacteriota bacterium]
MGRPLRHIPENKDGVLVEVTGRVIGARALLLPTPSPSRFNEIVVGLLGRAMEVSPVELCGCVVMANHWHVLLAVRDQQQLSRFMHHFAGNASKTVGNLRGWKGTLWQRRYDGIVVSDEPEAQWNRLRYLLSHGVKEGLVESPLEWPGVHTAGPLVRGEKLKGVWFNKTKEYAAKRSGQVYGAYDFATRYSIALAPLPAFRHLEPEEYRDRIAQMLVEIQREGEAKRQGDSVAGVEKILSQNPHEPPTRQPKTSPRPRFHVASKEAREELLEEYFAFATQYKIASAALRLRRKTEAIGWFPEGSYPPASPFVGPPPPPRPPAPPTRRLTLQRGGVIDRGELPVVEIPAARAALAQARDGSRARGRPD